jgi:Flp pilus assembly protein TadD
MIAYHHHQLGKYREAINNFDIAIQLNPNVADSYIGKGPSLEKLGQDEEAIFLYEKAIELNPTSAISYHNLGVSLGQ